MEKPRFIKLYSFIKENGKDSYKTCDVRKLKTWLENNNDYKNNNIKHMIKYYCINKLTNV